MIFSFIHCFSPNTEKLISPKERGIS